MQSAIILVVFFLTYFGMALGTLPWLRLDRPGIGLAGVILLLATEAVTMDDVASSIDFQTLVLLFALMVISAQFAASGFHDLCAARLAQASTRPAVLLGLTVAVCGGLSSVLADDIVIFALVPLLIADLEQRGLDPRPFVIAAAASANVGSSATIIGSPQNILLGEFGGLDFLTFLGVCGLPALVGLGIVWAVTWFVWRDCLDIPYTGARAEVPQHTHDAWQTMKGVAAVAVLIGCFVFTPRRVVWALVIAGFLLLGRRFSSRALIAAVDWPALVLIACLLAIVGALDRTGMPGHYLTILEEAGLMPDNLVVLTPLTLVLGNVFGGLPSIVLLTQFWPNPPAGALYGFALLSSLAGNLVLTGSLTTMIAVSRAAAHGVRIGFGAYAKVGVPVTLLSMAVAVLWLAAWHWLPWLPSGGLSAMMPVPEPSPAP